MAPSELVAMSRLGTFVAAAAGVGFGVSVGLLIAGRSTPASAAVVTAPTPSAASVGDPSLAALTQMSQRMSAAEARLNALTAAAETKPAASASAAPRVPPTPEEMRAQTEKVRANLLGRMNAEGVDPRWAPRTASSFRQDLQSMGAAQHFDVREVTCRTTMCAADLEWTDSHGRRPQLMSVLGQVYGVNCQRHGTIFEPNDTTPNYTAKLIFDCESSRAAGN
jgi:hypothetical protein